LAEATAPRAVRLPGRSPGNASPQAGRGSGWSLFPRGSWHRRGCTSLPPHGTPRATCSSHVHLKCLARRIDMVKVEVQHASVIAAHAAGASSLVDEESPHLSVAAGDCLADATPTAISVPSAALAVEVKFDQAVACALAHNSRPIPERRSPPLWDERPVWTVERHEPMFAYSPDGRVPPRMPNSDSAPNSTGRVAVF
jgi:hypothetical protein